MKISSPTLSGASFPRIRYFLANFLKNRRRVLYLTNQNAATTIHKPKQERRMVALPTKRATPITATRDDVVAMRDRLMSITAEAKSLREQTKAQLDEWRRERAMIKAWFKRNEAEIADMFSQIARAAGDYTPEGYVDDDDT